MWFKTYQENRSCRVSVAGEFSDNIELTYGLPQGSVIGPLGFMFYIHIVGDILRQHHLNYHIYADDIQIYTVVDPTVPGDSACALFKLTRCVYDIKQCMIKNKLKLNPDKTEFFISSSPYHQSRLNNLSLQLDDTVILPSATVRNLGVTFDCNMTMTQHVTNLCQSVQICNSYKIRMFIDSDTCANIVRALILSCLDYCNLLFNGITQKNLVRLQELQNKCARLVNMQPRSCHITPLLMDLHWLRVSERIIFKTLLYVYKSLNGLCPQYMNDCLVVNRPHLGSVTPRSGHAWPEPRCFKDTEVCWGQSLFSGCSTTVE